MTWNNLSTAGKKSYNFLQYTNALSKSIIKSFNAFVKCFLLALKKKFNGGWTFYYLQEIIQPKNNSYKKAHPRIFQDQVSTIVQQIHFLKILFRGTSKKRQQFFSYCYFEIMQRQQSEVFSKMVFLTETRRTPRNKTMKVVAMDQKFQYSVRNFSLISLLTSRIYLQVYVYIHFQITLEYLSPEKIPIYWNIIKKWGNRQLVRIFFSGFFFQWRIIIPKSLFFLNILYCLLMSFVNILYCPLYGSRQIFPFL